VKELLGNSIFAICEVLGISFRSVQSILKGNLNMFHVAAKFIPCLLSEELTLVCVHVNLWLKAKCHTPSCLHTRFSTMWRISFPRTQDGIKLGDI